MVPVLNRSPASAICRWVRSIAPNKVSVSMPLILSSRLPLSRTSSSCCVSLAALARIPISAMKTGMSGPQTTRISAPTQLNTAVAATIPRGTRRSRTF